MDKRKEAKGSDLYKSLSKTAKMKCKEAKNKWIIDKCANLENTVHLSEKYSIVKELTGDKKSNKTANCIKSKDGKLLFDKKEVLGRWTEYIGCLFEDDRVENPPMVSNLDGPPIIAAEVEYALKKMKSGKAPGLDNISTEMLKAIGNFGIEKLTEIFNDIYYSSHLPEDLLQSVFITLPKKTRAMECGDFRTISLMSNVTKLLLKVLLERMKRKIEYEISDEQFGFRPKLGTREEFIFRETSKYHGLNIGGRKFNNIRYADDTVLLTKNAEDLQLLAEAVNKHSNDAGLEMNVKNTKTMVVTKFPPKATSIKIKGESIEQVSSFKYLGQEVNDSNNQDDELKKTY
ncbi:RNA-directed DNA polymerase from mobile element jockey-like [Elysia marginata]|uniref:RNA-directed DNA polymerase from mobile element jockey-like n=1 Tax=Elysia marginata TaxID=1093978 RepID=A0AAV4GV64_9GAST|nr:RNA-directed DNA polymerase from mobile element jockey-like [Elysia marginata]